MQPNLEITLVGNQGNIRLDKYQGFFTIEVVDAQKKPVAGLTSDNFLLYCDAEQVMDIKTSERDAGIYSLEFYFERRCLTTLKKEESEDKPLEVMLTVQTNTGLSNTRLILMFKPKGTPIHVLDHTMKVYDEIQSVEEAVNVFQQHAEGEDRKLWAGIYLHWQHGHILVISDVRPEAPPHPYQDAVLHLEYRNETWQKL